MIPEPDEKPTVCIGSLRDLFFDQLRGLHSMERRIIECFPKLAADAENPELAVLLREQADVSRIQRERLMLIFELHEEGSDASEIAAFSALIEEAATRTGEPSALTDAALAGHIMRIQHYQIACYSVALNQAETLELGNEADALSESLVEERHMENAITRRITGGLFHKGLNEVAAEISYRPG